MQSLSGVVQAADAEVARQRNKKLQALSSAGIRAQAQALHSGMMFGAPPLMRAWQPLLETASSEELLPTLDCTSPSPSLHYAS